MTQDLPRGGQPTTRSRAAAAGEEAGRGLGGGSHGLLLSGLGLTDGVPWKHQLLDHGVRGTLRGEAVFLKEGKEGDR